MPKQPKREERYQDRVLITGEVRIQVNEWDPVRTEQIVNISEGGLQVKTNQPLSPGTHFRWMAMVGGKEVSGQAEVIWTKEFPSHEQRESGMGAKFVALTPAARRWIAKYISDHQADIE